jgi:hypothetical protein
MRLAGMGSILFTAIVFAIGWMIGKNVAGRVGLV